MSIVRNVALFGRPSAGPVIASISSIVYLPLSSAFSAFQISLIGISPWAFAVYQLAFQSEVLFHHSNVRLPIRFERLLSKVLVTPRMHGIHHSQVRRENNSNFGTVFPWWDRLHRTLGLCAP